MNLLEEIETMESCFQKKYHLIKICLEYEPTTETLKNNLALFYKFLSIYMVCRMNFKKKDDRVQQFIQRFMDYIQTQKDIFKNHTHYLSYQLLCLYIGIMKSDHGLIREIHKDILKYMDYHILKTGIMRDAMEHDALNYQINNLMDLCVITTTLQKYGFYHFDYLNHKNMVGSSILKAFLYLQPYILEKKFHYQFLNTIFEEDRKHPQFGSKWDPEMTRPLFTRFGHLHKKLKNIIS